MKTIVIWQRVRCGIGKAELQEDQAEAVLLVLYLLSYSYVGHRYHLELLLIDDDLCDHPCDVWSLMV